jgi:hypothetical protein
MLLWSYFSESVDVLRRTHQFNLLIGFLTATRLCSNQFYSNKFINIGRVFIAYPINFHWNSQGHLSAHAEILSVMKVFKARIIRY